MTEARVRVREFDKIEFHPIKFQPIGAKVRTKRSMRLDVKANRRGGRGDDINMRLTFNRRRGRR